MSCMRTSHVRRGSTGTYNHMRVIARNFFLKPVEDEIDKATADTLLLRWHSFGSLDKMVEECRRALPKTKTGEAHRIQTRRYLQEFQDDLVRWKAETDSANVAARELPGVYAAWKRVTEDSSPACRSFVSMQETVMSNPLCDWLPQIDFLSRMTAGGTVRIDFVRGPFLVEPRMTRAWPAAVSTEEVYLGELLHDFLRARTANGLPTVIASTEGYLGRAQFAAALRAAEYIGDANLVGKVREEAQRQRDSFRRQHSEILDEARTWRDKVKMSVRASGG